MPVVSHRLIEWIPASSCNRRHHRRIVAAGISPSNGQPKLHESDAATRIPAVAARAAASLMAWNEASPDMRRLARLWLSLADITRFTSSARATMARSIPRTLGTNAA